MTPKAKWRDDARTIRVMIQAGKKLCGWCHMYKTVCETLLQSDGSFKSRRKPWCQAYTMELEDMGESKGPMRCAECLESEATE